MTSQGSPQTRFRRAIERRSIFLAELAAHEMPHVTLEDALRLVVLYAEMESPKFEPAAVRWLARLALELKCGLPEVQLAAGALASLVTPFRDRAAQALMEITKPSPRD